MNVKPSEPNADESSVQWQSFLATAIEIGVPLSVDQLRRFQFFTLRLQQANEQFNLTAIRDLPSILRKLHLDSLVLIPAIAQTLGVTVHALRDQPQHAADVGTGAGIPGIPLCIAWPTLSVTFIESIRKKAAFVGSVISEIGLSATVIADRAEAVGQQAEYRERYDLVVARAVASLPTLLEITLPLARVGGIIALPKGPNVQSELLASKAAMTKLGGVLIEVAPLRVPGIEERRTLVLIRKSHSTPLTYPRRPGLPAKSPLM